MTDAVNTFIAYYFDPKDLFSYLLLLMGFDIATGIIASARHRKINSSIAWRGITRKAATVAAVLFLLVIEPVVKVQLGRDLGVSWLVTIGFIGSEVLSIIENLARSGVPVPDVVKDTFAKVAPPPKTPPKRAARKPKPKDPAP